eukprot:scaffold2188_cov102-Isochrysis_galbana.AAC.18
MASRADECFRSQVELRRQIGGREGWRGMAAGTQERPPPLDGNAQCALLSPLAGAPAPQRAATHPSRA